MPTYEYRCNKCGHTFEMFQVMRAKPLAICPKCSGPLVRLIGAGSAVIFKGPGFHATDYGRAKGSSCGRETPCDTRPCEG